MYSMVTDFCTAQLPTIHCQPADDALCLLLGIQRVLRLLVRQHLQLEARVAGLDDLESVSDLIATISANIPCYRRENQRFLSRARDPATKRQAGGLLFANCSAHGPNTGSLGPTPCKAIIPQQYAIDADVIKFSQLRPR